MPSLLVTGGAGFIGGNFVRNWRKRHPDDAMVVLDALTYAGNRATIADIPDVTFVHGDICNVSLVRELLRDHDLDTIVHFAAETHVDRSIDGPEIFVANNVVGTQSLLEAARSEWLAGCGKPHRFHHVSTDEVYGALAPDDPGFTEQSQIAPNSPYAASKAASDHLVRAYGNTYGLEAVTTRCSNNYGPFQYPEKLIPRLLLNALNGLEMPVYGDGMQVRDWLHVEDHCRGIEAALKNGRPGETYNLGGGLELPNRDIVAGLCRTIDAAFERDPSMSDRFPNAPPARGEECAKLVRNVEDRPGHDRRYAIDDSKARDELSYEAEREFGCGLVDTVDWYLANEPWWSPLIRE